MRRLICRIIGHDWYDMRRPGYSSTERVIFTVCRRCLQSPRGAKR